MKMNKVLFAVGLLSTGMAVGQTQPTKSASTTTNTSNYSTTDTQNYNSQNATMGTNTSTNKPTSATVSPYKTSSGSNTGTGTTGTSGSYNNSSTTGGSNTGTGSSSSGSYNNTGSSTSGNTNSMGTGSSTTPSTSGSYNTNSMGTGTSTGGSTNNMGTGSSSGGNTNSMGTGTSTNGSYNTNSSGTSTTPSTSGSYNSNTGSTGTTGNSTYSGSTNTSNPERTKDYKNFAYGIYAGLNTTRYRGESIDAENPAGRIGYQAGFFVRGGGRLYGQIGAEYFASSANYFRPGDGQSAAAIRDQISVQYVQIPVYIGYKLTESDRGISAIRLQAGAEYANRIGENIGQFRTNEQIIKGGSFNALGQLGFDIGPFLIDLTYHHGLTSAIQLTGFSGSYRRMLSASVGFKF
ncbi:MAG TPA: PorT family protein [Fibrella sp.]